MIDRECCEGHDLVLFEHLEHFFGDLVTGIGIDFTGLRIDHVECQIITDQVFIADKPFGDLVFFQLLDDATGQLLTGFDNHITGVSINQILDQLHTDQALCVKIGLPAIATALDMRVLVEIFKDVFRRHAGDQCRINRHTFFCALLAISDGFITIQCQQQCGDRQFPPTVNTYEGQILGIEFEIQPGATVRNHPCGKEIFTR